MIYFCTGIASLGQCYFGWLLKITMRKTTHILLTFFPINSVSDLWGKKRHFNWYFASIKMISEFHRTVVVTSRLKVTITHIFIITSAGITPAPFNFVWAGALIIRPWVLIASDSVAFCFSPSSHRPQTLISEVPHYCTMFLVHCHEQIAWRGRYAI